jgi:hypothetical protein
MHRHHVHSTYRATYVNFAFKVYQVPASADGNLCLDFKMFLSQFPCEHQRHRQQTNYFNRCKETASDISSFKPQGFLLCSPQVLNLVRRAGKREEVHAVSRRGETHTHKIEGDLFFSFNSRSSRLKIVVFFFCWNDDYTRIHPPHR